MRSVFLAFVFLGAQLLPGGTPPPAGPGLLSAIASAVPVKLVPVISSGLKDPVYMTQAPGDDDKFYVVEQAGRIVTFENGKIDATPFLDIRKKVTSGGEMGLLGLAFHPKFQTNGRYFINYTTNKPHRHTVIAEYRVGSNEEKILATYDQPFTNHKGGMLVFDKQGYLYWAAGDGGSAGDPHGNGQNRDSWLGKIHRIDVDHGDPYAIPDDNPFAHGGGRKEIFAYGLRNPWRFSFDRETGKLFAGDVGQDLWEEIDIVENGKNYGWNIMEGRHCFKPSTGCRTEGLTLPIWEYGHDVGNCLIGGYVYRGSEVPELKGVYVYGDYGSGKIWGLHLDAAQTKVETNELLLDSEIAMSSFAVDNHGELYVVNYGGAILKFAKDDSRR